MTQDTTIQSAVDKAGDKHAAGSHDMTDVYSAVLQLQKQDHDPARLKADIKTMSDKLHAKGILTGLELTGADSDNHLLATQGGKQVNVTAANDTDIFQPTGQKTSWLQGLENVGSDIAKGAWNELTEHPLHLVESAAVGFAVGTAAALVAPEVAIGIGLAGAAYAGYELAVHIPGWVHDVKVENDPGKYSQKELAGAAQGLQGFGAGALDVTAGVAGGIAGGYTGSAIKAAFRAPAPVDAPVPDEVSDTTNGGIPDADDPKGTAHHAHANQGTIAGSSGNIPDASHAHAASGLPLDHSHAIAASLPSPDTGDDGTLLSVPQGDLTPAAPAGADDVPVAKVPPSESEAAPISDSPTTPAAAKPEGPMSSDQPPAKADPTVDAAKSLTSEEAELQASITQNQQIFNSAANDDAIVAAQKQSYNVMFKKVTEPGFVQTLENRAGEPVKPGQWLAIRLDANGQPVMEDGIVNQWPVVDKTILKSYQATSADLQQLEFVAGTKTGGAPVHMVQLKSPITIKTPWGSMSGKAGDWLANYDFNSATGTPGSDYAIVTGTSWNQTYEPVQPGLSS
ncbi:MAG TPA: hypothetical protein V6C97_36040 [Oculatellaceae cyanobacterium]